jgi:hypothetical protein
MKNKCYALVVFYTLGFSPFVGQIGAVAYAELDQEGTNPITETDTARVANATPDGDEVPLAPEAPSGAPHTELVKVDPFSIAGLEKAKQEALDLISKRRRAGKMVLGPDSYFIDKWRKRYQTDNGPLTLAHTRHKILVCNRIANAMQEIATQGADAAKMQADWIVRLPQLLAELKKEDDNSNSYLDNQEGQVWQQFLDEWRNDVVNKAPRRFKDALIEAAYQITKAGLGIETARDQVAAASAAAEIAAAEKAAAEKAALGFGPGMLIATVPIGFRNSSNRQIERVVRPDFLLDQSLVRKEREDDLPYRLILTCLWAMADESGRFSLQPSDLKNQIALFDRTPWADGRIEEALFNLQKYGFIQTSAGYGVFPGFEGDVEPVRSTTVDPLLARQALTMGIAILVFGIGIIVLQVFAVLRNSGTWDELALKSIGLTLLITAGIFILVAGYDKEQVNPLFALLGSLAGYLLGKDSRPRRPKRKPSAPQRNAEAPSATAEAPSQENAATQ